MTTRITSSTSTPTSQVDPLSQLESAMQAELGQGVSDTASTTGGASDLASMMSQLQQLQQSDPTKFKEVTQEIADTLKTDASAATGSQTALTKMADQFEQASQTGTMTPLKTSGSGHQGGGGHHHHHTGVQSYDQQQATDPLTSLLQSSSTDSSSTGSDTAQQAPYLTQVVQDALDKA